MGEPRPIEIIGGGLAGLSLGLALRRRDVPVTLFEAAHYPRPKVCGEFISGLDQETIAQLELEPWLAAKPRHREASWHSPRGLLLRHRLPQPAIGVSRLCLDTQLATAFRAAGGELRENQRVDATPSPAPGRVLAHGRRAQTGGWVGLKVHVGGVPLTGDLEMHLGRGAYVGLAGIEDGRVNVCGLFSPQAGANGPPDSALDRYLRGAGLVALAERLATAVTCEGSRAAVAGVHFGRNRRVPRDVLALGDAFAAIPPFTGHGMAMALQSAALALDPLVDWSIGRSDWPATTARVRRRLHRRFAVRLAAARLLHPWLLAPRRQALMGRLHARGLLPLRLLYHTLH